jgi:hypothetical protein
MAVYTYYLHEGRDKIPAFEIAMFEDEAPALDHGRRLLVDRPRYDFVEVALGDASIARLTRDASSAA